MTIGKVNGYYYEMKEDYGDWCWFEDMIEWLAEEEWTPKEWDVVLDIGKKDIILWRASQAYILVDTSLMTIEVLNLRGSYYWGELKKVKEKKKERKLMLTDSEWDKLKKYNNL